MPICMSRTFTPLLTGPIVRGLVAQGLSCVPTRRRPGVGRGHFTGISDLRFKTKHGVSTFRCSAPFANFSRARASYVPPALSSKVVVRLRPTSWFGWAGNRRSKQYPPRRHGHPCERWSRCRPRARCFFGNLTKPDSRFSGPVLLESEDNTCKAVLEMRRSWTRTFVLTNLETSELTPQHGWSSPKLLMAETRLNTDIKLNTSSVE